MRPAPARGRAFLFAGLAEYAQVARISIYDRLEM